MNLRITLVDIWVSRVTDFGNYLGVPLFHQRVTSEMYKFLLDKLNMGCKDDVVSGKGHARYVDPQYYFNVFYAVNTYTDEYL